VCTINQILNKDAAAKSGQLIPALV